ICTARGIPQVAVDGRVARGRASGKFLRARGIGLALASSSDRILEPEQQTIQVNGHDFRGVDRRTRMRIREPARTEIPAAFRGSANIVIQLRRLAPAVARELAVLAVGLVARSIAIVPVAIEY